MEVRRRRPGMTGRGILPKGGGVMRQAGDRDPVQGSGGRGSPEDVPGPRAELNFESVLVGMSVVPFVQAITAQLGDRVGVVLGESTGEIINRLLNRRRQSQDSPESEIPKVELVDNNGWTVVIESGLPEEALYRLQKMRPARMRHAEDYWFRNYVMMWRESTWRMYRVEEVSIAGHRWNSSTGQWEPEDRIQ